MAPGKSEIAKGVDEYNDDSNEPTMGEKLAVAGLPLENIIEVEEVSAEKKPPSADSIHVLLKQALNADDRALLISCLLRQDEKVITNSVASLNLSDVIKLLKSLVPMVQSRGAVLARALPWLRSVLLQHSSGIISQESSFIALNSLYQLIESRVSTLNEALQLSSSLDVLYARTIGYDSEEDEDGVVAPVVYEDTEDDDDGDESDEEDEEDGSVVSMEIEGNAGNKEPHVFSDTSDVE